MKIQTTLDKVLIDQQELQSLVKAYILEKTRRAVYGGVRFQKVGHGEFSEGTAQMTAWCELEPTAINDN